MPELALHISTSTISAFQRGLQPDAQLSVSQWADEYRYLPSGSAEPGKFRMSRTPYIKEIIDRLSVYEIAQEVIFEKGSQIGATETGNNWLGYIIDTAPAPMLYVMPTDTMMKQTSKNRIQKMIETTPRIQKKIKPNRAKDSGNTMLHKEFEGGFANFVGANSPVGLASISVRYVYLDEVDRYPMNVGGEGSAIDLAKTRTVTFGSRKKLFITSTPTVEGGSAIHAAFLKTGQRYYHVPCPLCGTAQVLKFAQLKYEKEKIKSAHFSVTYECVHCHGEIFERYKTQMLAAGQWIPTEPENENGIVYGYHLSALYSPYGMYSWVDMAKDYENAQDDIPKIITFTNTKLGEVYNVKGDKPDWEVLWSKRETYHLNIPFKDVAFITAGVDVQADRLEVEIVGWIKGKRSQSLDYRVLLGDTSKEDVWKLLDLILAESFIREDDIEMRIIKMAIDTGYNTSYVYTFCRRHSLQTVIPVKGQDKQMIMVAPPRSVDVTSAGKKIDHVKVWNIGVSMIKSELYGWLKLMPVPDGSFPNGYCHFPQYDEKYFRGLTAEELSQTIDKKGNIVYQWMLKYKRNEPLDARVYSRAAAAVVGMDRFTDAYWDGLTNNAGTPVKDKNIPKKPVKRRSDFWK